MLAGNKQKTTSDLPSGDVLIVVNIPMGLNIRCRLVTWWIATYYTVVILVDAYIVEPHRGRKQGGDSGEVDAGETVGHAKIENDRHRFFWENPLTDVSIWSQ